HSAAHQPVQAQSQQPLNEVAETRAAGLGVHAKPSSYAAPTLSDGAPSRSLAPPPAAQMGCSFLFSQGGCQTHQGPSEDGWTNLRPLRAMPVAHAPQCSGVTFF